MKKLCCILLTLVLALGASAAPAEGQAATVTAEGNATVTLTPDIATFTVGVSTQDTLVATAQSANAKAMQAVIDKLTGLGVAAGDIQTDQYSINPIYDYQNGKFGDQQALKGYEVSNTVSVTVRRLDQTAALIDAATQAGANQTYGLSFSSTQSAAAYDQALQSATQDALRKAKLIAQASGRELGDVLSLSEETGGYSQAVSYKSVEADSLAATPIENGTLTVNATVRAVAEIK